MIDWKNPKAQISKYFTAKDALWLPSWGVLHQPSETEKENILRMARKMDEIREFLAGPIIVHCWLRPGALNAPGHPKHGQDYNAFVHGAAGSQHKLGLAVDWHLANHICDDVRARLVPQLANFGIRMEDLKGSNWVHTDLGTPFNGNRYFKP